jgi:hypothetical protein
MKVLMHHSQRAARSFVRGLEIRLYMHFPPQLQFREEIILYKTSYLKPVFHSKRIVPKHGVCLRGWELYVPFTLAISAAILDAIFFFWWMWTSEWVMNVQTQNTIQKSISIVFCVSAIRHDSSLGKYHKEKQSPPWMCAILNISRGWLLLFTVLAEWRIMTNSAYAKNNGDGLLYSILWFRWGYISETYTQKLQV